MNRFDRKAAVAVSLALVLSVLMMAGLFTARTAYVFGESASEPLTEQDGYAALTDAADPDEVAAVILHTNDVHCAYEDFIGYDGLALYRKELEQVYDNVFLVDSGDAIQGKAFGAITKGQSIIRIMNRAGYDLAIPGNHEFDYGMEALDDCADLFDGEYICANFRLTDGSAVFKPWEILDAGGLHIGFVGAVTPDTYTKTSIKNILNESGEPMYDFCVDQTGEKLYAVLQGYVDEVRREGADIVILVSHTGNSDELPVQFRTKNIVAHLSGVDAVLDGHSHELYSLDMKDKDRQDVVVTQTGTRLQSIGQLTIFKDGHMEETLVKKVPQPAGLPAEAVSRGGRDRFVDPDMHAFLEELGEEVMSSMNQKIGEASFDLLAEKDDDYTISRARESALCELVADAYRAECGTDIGFTNAGSIRNNILKGDITCQTMLDILPYSNEILTVSLSGRTLKDVLEYAVSELPLGSAHFPQVSGVTFSVDASIVSSVRLNENGEFSHVDGPYRVSDIMVDGKKLDPAAEYTMATGDYIVNGGDGFTMFSEADVLSDTMKVDNMVVKDYIETTLGGVIPDMYRAPCGRIQIRGMAAEEQN